MDSAKKELISKWIIISASLLWIGVGTWGAISCQQLANNLKESQMVQAVGNNSSLEAALSESMQQDLKIYFGINMIRARGLFAACIIASVFTMYSVLTMAKKKNP